MTIKGHYFRDKYILVEEYFNDFDYREEKILEGGRGDYYINTKGQAFIVYRKNGRKRILTKFKKRNAAYVKIGKLGDLALKNLVAKTFLNAEREEVVVVKNGKIFDCRVENLVVMSKEERGRITGALAKSQPVGLFENGKLIKKWPSARKCAKSLFCSYQCVMDVCNGRTKNPMFDVRWL